MNPTMQKVLLGVGIAVGAVLINVGAYVAINSSKMPPQPTVQQPVEKPAQAPQEKTADQTTDTTLKALGFAPQFSEPDTTLASAANYEAIKKSFNLALTPGEEAHLTTEKSLLIPLSRSSNLVYSYTFDEMLTAFDRIGGNSSAVYREPQNAVFVTPDVVLHAYHKFFELTLEELEKGDLATLLDQFLSSLWENLKTQTAAAPSDTRPRFEKLLAQITVARVLFDTKNSPKPSYFDDENAAEKYNKADEKADTVDWARKNFKKYAPALPLALQKDVLSELTLIFEASQMTKSPLWREYNEIVDADYTQYTPRSHYSKTSRLRAYFRTMMYLGRSSYFFKEDVGITDSALLASQFSKKASSGVTPTEPWKKIMEVTGFYAGQADDITYTEWKEFLDKIGAQNTDQIKQNLSSLRLPKILSEKIVKEGLTDLNELIRETQGFKIFGQRFTYDAWILNQLSNEDRALQLKPPSLPSSLYVPAILGSARAKEYLTPLLVNERTLTLSELPKFFKKFDEVQKSIRAVEPAEWFSSMGTAWLDLLSTLTHTFGSGYPRYMQKPSFLDKQIQTFLGSYTELKHDTLLYAKQSYAELGGGGGDDDKLPPIVKGLVEPNVLFWRKLDALVTYT
ncbi:MAG: DUF3160 domain-containing protein, partial [Patescibacteria group bacterium]